MRIAALVFLLAALAAAGEFVDKPTGLKVSFPDDWRRDTSREQGAVKFAGFLGEKGEYLTLTVEAVPLMESFDSKSWLEHEKLSKTKTLNKSVTQDFKAEETPRVGGLDAVGYLIGGVATPKDKDIKVRFRVRGLVHGSHFFKITEVSVNGAHEKRADKLQGIWDGIQFQAAEGNGDGEGGGGIKASEGQPQPVEDKAGNFKTKLPAGWEVAREAPAEKKVELRMVFVRKDNDGNNIASIEVRRISGFPKQVINSGTPDEVVQKLMKEAKFWAVYYGEGYEGVVRADVDEGVGLGSAERSGEYEMRSKTMDQITKIAEAETLKRRGDKNIKVPEFLDTVVRGRVAILSPHIYITRCTFVRSLADDAQLVAEYKAVHDSLEFLVAEALPQPLNIGGDVGDTVSNPGYAKDRKDKVVYDVRGNKTYRMELKFTLPAGFVRFDKKLPAEHIVMIVYAQDAKNNWMQIVMIASNQKKRVDDNPGKIVPMPSPEKDAEQWKSNWTGTARGVKVPAKLKKFSLGKIKGKGYDGLSGNASGFRAKFWGIASNKVPGKGWYILVTVETRGDGDKLFEGKMKKLFKSMKAKNIKVK